MAITVVLLVNAIWFKISDVIYVMLIYVKMPTLIVFY